MPETRRKLLEASVRMIMQKGFAATTVDQICAEAQLTKGSFFHYFKSKEEIGIAAVRYFACGQSRKFESAGLDAIADPVERLHAFLDVAIQSVECCDGPCVCMTGMMAQEMAATNESVKNCCSELFSSWVEMVAGLLGAAKAASPHAAEFDPASVAWMLSGLVQGSMLVAKTREDSTIICENIRHFRRYVDGLLGVGGA